MRANEMPSKRKRDALKEVYEETGSEHKVRWNIVYSECNSRIAGL